MTHRSNTTKPAGHAFAPGVITAKTSPARRRLRRWVRTALMLAAVALGYLSGHLLDVYLHGGV